MLELPERLRLDLADALARDVELLADFLQRVVGVHHAPEEQTRSFPRPNVRLLTVEEICYFHAEAKYTYLVTADEAALIRTPLKELLQALDPSVFWQIHRSTIVNVNAIDEVTRDMRGHLLLRLKSRKEALPVSQPFAHLFRQM